jgi:uncharacterized membrane protein YhaH (DUF805 family)
VFYPSRLLAPLAPRAGRLSQATYILGFVLPFIAVLGLSWLVFFGAPGLLGMPGLVVLGLGWALVMMTGDAYNIRRWNDLGSSAALYKLLRPGLVLLPLLAFALQFLVPAHLAMAGDMQALVFMMGMEFGGVTLQPAPLALLAITLAAGLANVVYLSVMPGQQGPNAYGPDPHGDPLVPGAGPGAHPNSGDAGDDPVKRALAEYHRQRTAPAPTAATAAVARSDAGANRATAPGAFGKKRR